MLQGASSRAYSVGLVTWCLSACRYIQEHLPNDVRSRCHFFNSFFFKKLTEKGPRKSGDSAGSGGASDSAYKRGFERVRKWTRVCWHASSFGFEQSCIHSAPWYYE